MTDLSSYKPLVRKADDGIATYPFPAHNNAYHTTPFVQKTGDTLTGDLNMSGNSFNNVFRISSNGYLGQSGASVAFYMDTNGSTDAIHINGNLLFPVQAPTASAPSYVLGGLYYDTTLKKLRVGGATAWETVTSA